MDKAEIARKNRQRGKANEKALASILNAARVGIFGGEDLFKDKYSIEAKSRKSFVAEKWMIQSEKNCKGRIPIVVVHITGKQHDNDLVMFRLKDCKNILKG